MTHTSSYRYGALSFERPSGAASGEVRVSYFDPQTGERADAPKASNRKARKRPSSDWGKRCPSKAVAVDGALFPTIKAAANAAGVITSTMSRALREGRKDVNGHEVEYADDER